MQCFRLDDSGCFGGDYDKDPTTSGLSWILLKVAIFLKLICNYIAGSGA